MALNFLSSEDNLPICHYLRFKVRLAVPHVQVREGEWTWGSEWRSKGFGDSTQIPVVLSRWKTPALVVPHFHPRGLCPRERWHVFLLFLFTKVTTKSIWLFIEDFPWMCQCLFTGSFSINFQQNPDSYHTLGLFHKLCHTTSSATHTHPRTNENEHGHFTLIHHLKNISSC